MDEIDPYEEEFSFPQQVLDAISECSPDGFLLFTIDEAGDVQMFKRDVTDIVEVGLRAKTLKILNALDLIEEGDVTNSIISQRQGKPSEEGEEDSPL